MALQSLAILLLLPLSSFALPGRADDIVDTGYAKYAGNRTFPNAVAYLGLPYAEPPLGELRFRAPVPLNTTRITESANGEVIDATKYPDFCIQRPGGAGAEDCLTLNVYTPASAKKGDKLPVLYYIHGGGYLNGNPRNWPFDHWIQQSPNFIAVSVYYRLSVFGFLSTPAFNDPKNGDFNAGFLDQIQGLKWVKSNIESFGGDPEQVTINGESAGGGSVEHHLVANEGEKLFSGAIAQSVYRAPTPTPDQTEPLFNQLVNATGCAADGIGERLACLRTVEASALAAAQDGNITGPYKTFQPVVDGKVIVGNPTILLQQGKFAKVPVIVGATSNETVIGGRDIATALQSTFPLLADEDVKDILDVAPEEDFSSASQRFQVITGESLLICAREIIGGAYSTAPKSWTYRYNQPQPTPGGVSSSVNHAAENYMMFLGTVTGRDGSTTFNPLTEIETAFAEELIAYWISFVRSGDPNKFKLDRSPEWPQYTPEDKQRIVLQEDPTKIPTVSGSFIETEPANESRRCEVVASKAERQQN